MVRARSRKLNKGDQSNGRSWSLWEDQVALFIINSGTNGRGWQEILSKYKGIIDTETLRNFLEALRVEGKLDRFQVPHSSGKGKPKTVYRATTKILEV